MQKAVNRQRNIIEKFLTRGFYSVEFQPVINSKSAKIFAFEALMRGPEGASFSDLDLIFNGKGHLPSGLLYKIDMARLGSAIRAGRHLSSQCKLFINLHGVTLKKISGKLRLFFNLLNEVNTDPGQIIFEISANTHNTDLEDIAMALREFRKSGVGIAIDDPGLLYPWLQYFYWLEPDFVKINNDLIRCIDSDSKKQMLVGCLAMMAKHMGCRVIAGGVERMEEWFTLDELGIDFAQGYYLGKPHTVDKWLNMINPDGPKHSMVSGISAASSF